MPPTRTTAPRLKVSLTDGKMDDEAQSAMTLVFGGRYKAAGEKPLPPVKPGAVFPHGPCVTMPNPSYLKHSPRYFPPDPPFPLQQELDSLKAHPDTAPAPRSVNR